MTTQEYLVARKSKNWKFSRVVNENAFKNVSSDLDICIDWNQDCYDEEGVIVYERHE